MRLITKSGVRIPRGDFDGNTVPVIRVTHRWIHHRAGAIRINVFVPRTCAEAFSPRRLAFIARQEAFRRVLPHGSWNATVKRVGGRDVKVIDTFKGGWDDNHNGMRYSYVFTRHVNKTI